MKPIQLLKAKGINSLKAAYISKQVTPEKVIFSIKKESARLKDHNIWITPPDDQFIKPYLDKLGDPDFENKPLWGVPFAIKDNIDFSPLNTTAGCASFSYPAKDHAYAVEKLLEAGALPIGKTNMDQFATGLVGTRSPFGVTTHPDRPELISGGSSSGSAIAVACGLASFALGTDTAGSGRVPAAFNEIVGFKPTRGLISCRGVVPACKSIDCLSIFTNNVSDAAMVANICAIFDASDTYARRNQYNNDFKSVGAYTGKLRLGFIDPDWVTSRGSSSYAAAYRDSLRQLEKSGIELFEFDFDVLYRIGQELYNGPWVAERSLAFGDFLDRGHKDIIPVTNQIIKTGQSKTAEEFFSAQYRVKSLKRSVMARMNEIDALITPTVPRNFTIEEVQQSPIQTNNTLGIFTNHMNIMDFCGIAIPAKRTREGSPFGISLIADRMHDSKLLSLATGVERILSGDQRVTPLKDYSAQHTIELVVCGAHLSGMPLNHQLVKLGAELIEVTRTADEYKLYALSGESIERPGLVHDMEKGSMIDVEIWRMPISNFGIFIMGIPRPLGIGKVKVKNGQVKPGFICEGSGIEGATDITHHGGWRTYMQTF
tara:strand:- start:986 stop:2782 length:1797 start_codon:yes stop_codon:yes gene_type:complete